MEKFSHKETFSRNEVERSFRKFDETVDDLFKCVWQTWPDHFTRLITHCENDPVMKLVTEPLRQNRKVNAETWYTNAMSTASGSVGSGRYELPYDDDDRTALLYQFFLLLEKKRTADFPAFCMNFYGTTNYPECCACFNQELVLKFTREVSNRLEEILARLGNQQVVRPEAMSVFNNHSTTNIYGGIHGSNVASGGSTLSDSTAAYTNNTELADALKALKPLVREVAENQRSAVEAAISLLVKAATDPTDPTVAPADDVQKAATIVASGSPSLKDRMLAIVQRVSESVASSSILLALKKALGIP